MDIKLHLSKQGICTTEEVVNEEYTLRYGHIFRGRDGKDGVDGTNGRNGVDGVTPLFKIEYDYWYVSYNNGQSWQRVGRSTGADGANGKDAYKYAIDGGYQGSEKEFVDDLSEVANKVDKVAGKGLSTNDYTDAEKAKVADIDGLKQSIEGKANTNGNYPNMTVGKANGVVGINQVQEALTLSTKANGNIVIGNLAGQSKEFMPATPSGDPMHYAYEAAGATWNANTGYWKMYTLTDVTNEQMRAAVARGAITCGEKQPLCNSYRSLNGIRFNLARAGNYFVYLGVDSVDYYAYANDTIEVINLTFYKNLGSQYDGAGLNVASLNHAFSGCSKLRQILGKILASGSSINTTNAFKGCTSLEDLLIAGLGSDISFADSPNLSSESILYMIENATATTAITITLHEDAYMRAMAEDSIKWALENHPNVKLAQA